MHLYESLVAWSGGTHRTLGRATSLRGAPRDAIRIRAAMSRSLTRVRVVSAGPVETPEPPSEPAAATIRQPRAPITTSTDLLGRRAG